MGNSQFNFSTKVILVTAIIAAVAAFSISAVRNSNIYRADEGAIVGKLTIVEGEVQIRSEDGDFRRVSVNQAVADGDQIVTGKDSKAVIDLSSGRKASCLANSRITVTSLEDHRLSPTILVDATRAGQAEASTSDDRANPVILLTGNGAVTVNAGESVATKSSGAAGPAEVTKTNTKTGVKVTIAKVDEADRTKRIQDILAVVATPTPSPSATPKPTPKAAPPKIDLAATLLSPAPGSILWTTSDLEKLANESIPITLSLKGPVDATSLTLELRQEAKSTSKAIQEKLAATGEAGKYAARIPMASVISNSVKTSVSGSDRRTFSLAILSGNGNSTGRVNLDAKVTVGSFAPLSRLANVVVGIQTIGEKPQSGPWMSGKFQSDPDTLPFVIRTIKPGLAAALLSSLRSSPIFSAQTGASIAAAGVFVVKNQEIIAQLNGTGINNEATDRLREMLDGDFVFTGPQDALVSAQKYSVEEIQKMIAGSMQSGKSIYVFQDQSLFQVNAEFVRKHPSVASFVRRNSNAFFTRQVKINSFR